MHTHRSAGGALVQYNVTATPQVDGVTFESLERIGVAVVRNIDRLRLDELPEHCANADAWPRIQSRE